MSTSSDAAVTSPSMSTTLAPSSLRTSMVAVASGIAAPFRAAQGDVLVGRDPHEVRQPGDLEDLAVVVAEAPRPHLDPVRARPREQAHDERDPRAVDVARVAEVERNG